ncbi:unnamed protein product [Ectocarpus sp. 8 AP-2014]
MHRYDVYTVGDIRYNTPCTDCYSSSTPRRRGYVNPSRRCRTVLDGTVPASPTSAPPLFVVWSNRALTLVEGVWYFVSPTVLLHANDDGRSFQEHFLFPATKA